jgi:hypothetical protein
VACVEVDDEGALRNSTKLDWYFWSRGAMRRWTSPLSLTFSSSVYGAYLWWEDCQHEPVSE